MKTFRLLLEAIGLALFLAAAVMLFVMVPAWVLT